MHLFQILFQKLGHEIILQLKDQKKKGKTGPLKLQRTTRKPRKSMADSDSDDDKKFTNITAQLAWERDIDLTKGQAFTKNPSAIESTEHVKPGGLANNIGGHISPDKKSDKKTGQTEEQTGNHIANGHVNSARTIKKFVKKPNGTPKTSPKFQKQFSINRVTPLPLDLNNSDDLGLDGLDSENTSRTESKTSSGKRPASLDTKRTVSSIQFDLDHFVVKADNKYVTNISQVAPETDKKNENQSNRAESADSKELYDQWVDEIIEGSRETSPSKSESGSPSHKHKSKKHKREKKEHRDKEKKSGSKEGRRSRSGERKRSPRIKTPTSDELLLVDSDAPVDESTL